jgi:hypothetical protein
LFGVNAVADVSMEIFGPAFFLFALILILNLFSALADTLEATMASFKKSSIICTGNIRTTP